MKNNYLKESETFFLFFKRGVVKGMPVFFVPKVSFANCGKEKNE